MAQLRKKPRVDYKKLADGPAIPCDSTKSDRWSTKKLYKLVVKESRLEDGTLKLYVHYIGWPTRYDEWRVASEVLDIPEVYTQSSPEGK